MDGGNLELSTANFIKAMMDAAETHLKPLEKATRKPYITDQTWKLIQEKWDAKKTIWFGKKHEGLVKKWLQRSKKIKENISKKNNNRNKVVDANTIKVQEKIEKILGLKVNIVNKKNNSGKIVIEYKDLDQFELVSDLLTKN